MPQRTTLVLVSRPDAGALREAARAGAELAAQGIRNQRLVVNGLFSNPLAGDAVAEALAQRHARALESMPAALRAMPTAGVPLVALDLTGVTALRALASGQTRGQPRAAGSKRTRRRRCPISMRWSTSWPPALRARCW